MQRLHDTSIKQTVLKPNILGVSSTEMTNDILNDQQI